jgi:hypothetical protein
MPSLCVTTGNMQTLSGGGLPQGTVTFQLMNLAIGTIPQVTGTALLPKTQYQVQTALDGSFTVNLWGNDNIVPSTTFYGVTFRDVSGNELGPILFYLTGASVNLNTLAAASGGALAIVNAVLTTPTITTPIINGTSTGTGILTQTIKKGSGAGTYTSTSTTLINVDGTNLSYTVTIPNGWKLTATASGSYGTNTGNVNVNIALVDTATSTVLQQVILFGNTTQAASFSLNGGIIGDGASHTVTLQYLTSNGADAITIQNSSTAFPVMTFLLSPSN